MPLTSYFVDFIAHVDERKRPENFPRVVHDKQVFEVESIPHLQFVVNERFVKLVSQSGIVVFRNDDEPVDEGKITFDKRVFVPWHMITYMELDVKMVTTKQDLQDSIVPGHILPDKPKETVN